MVLLCGRYEGFDERVRERVTEELSIGDYVLTGGELPALVVLDAVARLVPGVVGDEQSVAEDSFSRGLLDFPQYTRPPEIRGERCERIAWRRRDGVPACCGCPTCCCRATTRRSADGGSAKRWPHPGAAAGSAGEATLDEEEQEILRESSRTCVGGTQFRQDGTCRAGCSPAGIAHFGPARSDERD